MIEAVRMLSRAGARFVVIGGQAIRMVGFPRTTIDWDLFVPPHDEDNFRKINSALEDDLDIPVIPLGPGGQNFVQTYQTQWGVLQFHLLVPGVPKFDEAERAAVEVIDGGVRIKRLSGPLLLASKRSAGRPQDIEDIEFLVELEKAGKLI